MPTSPSKGLDCDPAEQNERQAFLDQLYIKSGRDRKNHPLYSTYTGLYQEWTQQQRDEP